MQQGRQVCDLERNHPSSAWAWGRRSSGGQQEKDRHKNGFNYCHRIVQAIFFITCPCFSNGREKHFGHTVEREKSAYFFDVQTYRLARNTKKRSALQKSRPLFMYLRCRERDDGLTVPGFPGVCAVPLQSGAIYRGTAPGPFPQSDGQRSRNRPCIPHNGCPRHPEPQGPDGYKACRGQRRRNRPACP